jgi:xyloglucan-specific exo-beta-1,4-glucanase
LYFGFGGVAVDLQTPGTIMVAALNSWYVGSSLAVLVALIDIVRRWPDGQIFRSTNGGVTWSPLWSWLSYPTMNKFYTYSDSLAPWLGINSVQGTPGVLQIGWMMEGGFLYFRRLLR